MPTRRDLYAWDFQKGKKSLDVKVDGLGFAYVPHDLRKPHIDAGRPVAVLEDWWPSFPGYHLDCANRRQIAPALALVIEALRYGDVERPPVTGTR